MEENAEESTKPVDREALYNEVWTEPVTAVASRYGLSDVGLAKICRSLSIPLPSRGYWAKVKAGKKMGRAPLPKLKEAPRGAVSRLVKLPPEKVAVREEARKAVARVREGVSSLPLPEEGAVPHPLVRATSKRLHQRDGWPERTLLRSAPKEVLHLVVTKDALDRALSIADVLLKTMEKQGFEFEIDAERGMTLVKWLEPGTKMEFSLTEYVRRSRHEISPAEKSAQQRYWNRSRQDSSISYPHIPQYDFTPTGVLTIQVGRWPSRSWKDTPKKQLEQRMGEVVSGILALAQETYAKEQEEERQREARRRAVAHYEFLTKRRADELESFKQLEVQASNWERASRLRAYLDAVEQQAKAAGEVSTDMSEWLAWARAKADWLDPLISVSDPILDAPDPKRPSYW